MQRSIVSFAPFFFMLLTMLALSGCVGKIVLPPFKPPVESAPAPGEPPQTPPGQAQPEQTQPKQAPPEQTQPGQAQPEQTHPGQPGQAGPSAADEETPVKLTQPMPPLQPKLGPAASLYNLGERQLKEGNLGNAEMAMERALRIEPRNPYYWHVMAEIRRRQGKHQEAIQCCLKSNSLAAGNSQLIHRNKVLIDLAQTKDTDDPNFFVEPAAAKTVTAP